ncbi:histidine phosphatase family protein [Prosthecobacter sp.]|uniref:histidine phosphatase family protein n=1 Tax=Prosthecobacter sp. TaxID=1965333 RepID=UPI003783EDDE
MKTIWFIRHAESLSNAGFPTDTPHEIGLSEKGLRQAEALGEQWRAEAEPEVMVVSRYARTGFTAEPLRRRLPAVPVITLPLHELTFLAPARYIGTTETLRREPARQYWERCDPDYCDGEGAESFREFCARIDDSLAALRERAESRIVVVCHGYVIKAILWRQMNPGAPVTAAYMRGFFDFHLRCVVPNLMVYPFECEGDAPLFMLTPFQIQVDAAERQAA